jgi:hypothetical protein
MRIYEKLFGILNIAFVFYHIFSLGQNMDQFSVNPLTMLYCSIFFWLMAMNYFFEGLKLQSLLYVIAHPCLIYSEMSSDDMEKGLGLGFFIAVSITAMTLVLFFSESSNVPARGEYDSGFKELTIKDKIAGDDIRMSAFYPIKKKGRFEKKGEKPDWCPNGDKTISGMFVGGKFSKRVFEFLRYSKINAYVD